MKRPSKTEVLGDILLRQITKALYLEGPAAHKNICNDADADNNNDGDDTVSCLTAHLMQGSDSAHLLQGNDYQNVLICLRCCII